jgi:hypothetical protein
MLDPRPQRDLAVIVPIKRGSEGDLRDYLDAIGDEIPSRTEIDFRALTTVHYLRWTIVDARTGAAGKPIGHASLVLSTNFDPPRRRHLDELIRVAGRALDEIYGRCEGYPGRSDTAALRKYFERHRARSAAFYVGHPWRTVQQIRDEKALRDSLERAADDLVAAGSVVGKTAAEAHQQLRSEMEARSSTQRVAYPPWIPRTRARLFLASAAWILVLLPLLVPLGVLALWLIFYKEPRDARRDDPDGSIALAEMRGRIKEIAAREDYLVVNQMTLVSDIKPGLVRQVALRLVLAVINLLARYHYNRGHLGGIPTIHYARWVIIDRGKRLLFFSNFDGSWESYLGDFIDKAAKGLTGIWSNTRGFPATRYLVLQGGARDEERFKIWARAQQVRTQVWYAAYPDLTVRNINNDTAIRAGLAAAPAGGEMAKMEMDRWAKRL